MKKNNIVEEVNKQIKTGKVKMRSRYAVIAEKLGLGSALALSIILAVVAVDLLFYWLDVSNNLSVLSFGSIGILAFLETFPYIPLGIGILLIVLAGYILKKFDVSYKAPIIVGVSLLILIPFLGGIAINYSGVNEAIENKVENGKLPPMKQYFGLNAPMAREHQVMGEVTNIKDDKLTIEVEKEAEIDVVIAENTSLPDGDSFSVGDWVRAIGKKQEDSFIAQAIFNLSKHRDTRFNKPVSPPLQPNR